MKHNEIVCGYAKWWFSHSVNKLAGLSETLSYAKNANKILKCLTREWLPKVTAIKESQLYLALWTLKLYLVNWWTVWLGNDKNSGYSATITWIKNWYHRDFIDPIMKVLQRLSLLFHACTECFQ